MSRYRSYGKLDDQPVVDGDRAFLGFGSFRDAGSIPENYLAESQNLRLETNSAIVRKGLKRLVHDATVLGSTVLASTFYRDPASGAEYVVLACSDRAYFVNPADDTKKTILYAGGETAAAGCMLMQAFHYLFLWRTDSPALPFTLPTTLGKYPLIFDGEDLAAETGTFVKPAETSTIPPSSYAIYASSRLCVLTGRDTVRFSLHGDPNTFRYEDQITFNAGDSDIITSLSPIEGDALMIGKRRSLLVRTNITDLWGANGMTSEVSNQFGIVARETVRQVGGLIFFLNDSGVYSVNAAVRGSSRVGTPVAYLQITDDPISADIEDEIEAIDFTTARTTACAVVASNRYYLATPSSASGNDRILIYNIVLNSWESVDTLPFGVYVENLIRIIYENQLRVAAICSSGKVLLLEENADGTDEYGNTVEPTTAAVDAKAVTRLYRGGDVSSVKRWKIATIGSTTKTAASTKFRVLANTREPDSAEVELGEFTTTAIEEDFRRLGIRQRGNGIQITVNNGKAGVANPAGRWELRDISIEGHTGSRQRRSYA